MPAICEEEEQEQEGDREVEEPRRRSAPSPPPALDRRRVELEVRRPVPTQVAQEEEQDHRSRSRSAATYCSRRRGVWEANSSHEVRKTKRARQVRTSFGRRRRTNSMGGRMIVGRARVS